MKRLVSFLFVALVAAVRATGIGPKPKQIGKFGSWTAMTSRIRDPLLRLSEPTRQEVIHPAGEFIF